MSRRRTVGFIMPTLLCVPVLVTFSGGWALLFTARAERVLAKSDLTLAVDNIVSALTAMMALVASASTLALLRGFPNCAADRPGPSQLACVFCWPWS